jgi:hypothetical protein
MYSRSSVVSASQSVLSCEAIGVVQPCPADGLCLPGHAGPKQRLGLPVLEDPQEHRRDVVAPGALRRQFAEVPQQVLVRVTERPGELAGGLPVPLLQRSRLRAAGQIVEEQRLEQLPRMLVEGEQRAQPADPGVFALDEAPERIRYGTLGRDRVAARQHPPKMVRRRRIGQRTCLVAADKSQ